jgi:hypothetical protein
MGRRPVPTRPVVDAGGTRERFAMMKDVFQMATSRRVFLTGLFGATATACLGQGVAPHKAAVQARGKPSGLPFNAHFTDVAANAGLRAITGYGESDRKEYDKRCQENSELVSLLNYAKSILEHLTLDSWDVPVFERFFRPWRSQPAL